MNEDRQGTYDYRGVEAKWQAAWQDADLYRAVDDDPRPKYYVLEMLPYPSGDLHVGHAKNYTLGDTVARMMRMQGYNVIHPMGWDAFGLPAENAAIQRNIDPRAWTESNIANMRRQIRLMGTGYDWNREFATCDPAYYRWNQWIFLRMYERGLAYKREAPVNWCPFDQTVLANEQAEGGVCWRCGNAVERRNLSQWFFKITDYADRLLEGLDRLAGWPEQTRAMQRNWIGRSEGTAFAFGVDGHDDETIRVFTTRVDTVYGVTYVVLAAEHPLVKRITTKEQLPAVDAFAASLSSKSDLERTSLMAKAGVPTGAYAIHPLTGARIPIWIANYVLAEYGTGAVMGVPGHDERDFAFAQQYGLPIDRVIVPTGSDMPANEPLAEAYGDDGTLVNSDRFDGLGSEAARAAITDALRERGDGELVVNFRLRDWLLSRQRYWGTPIPIVYCPHDGEVMVPDDQLPVILPPNIPITGQGSPLARDANFFQTTCPKCGGPARRETDTMDTFVDSSWYFIRYLDSANAELPFDGARVSPWMPVNQYIGGSEHAVLHLLYARFFTMVLADAGMLTVDGGEPFERLFHQGMVWRNGEKMSKSRGNVVGIDETVETYGIDAMRLFLLKLAPPEDSAEWTDEGIVGRVRFVNRVWRTCEPFLGKAKQVALDALPACATEAERELVRAVHLALQSGADETLSRRFHYNTTTARLDELVNALIKAAAEPGEPSAALLYAVHVLPILLAPFAPHLAEELWQKLGYSESVHLARWVPTDPAALAVEQITLVVQINGKVRGRVSAAPGVDEETAVALALADANVMHHVGEKQIRKRIYVADKLLNLVVA
jgi:leucyl-tRNA synthetase